MSVLPGKLVDQLFDYLFFHIYVEAQHTDKGKELKKIPVLFRCAGKGAFRGLVFLDQILLHDLDLAFFQAEYLGVNAIELQLMLCVKVTFRQRSEQALNIIDGKDIFKIINKNGSKKIAQSRPRR